MCLRGSGKEVMMGRKSEREKAAARSNRKAAARSNQRRLLLDSQWLKVQPREYALQEIRRTSLCPYGIAYHRVQEFPQALG